MLTSGPQWSPAKTTIVCEAMAVHLLSLVCFYFLAKNMCANFRNNRGAEYQSGMSSGIGGRRSVDACSAGCQNHNLLPTYPALLDLPFIMAAMAFLFEQCVVRSDESARFSQEVPNEVLTPFIVPRLLWCWLFTIIERLFKTIEPPFQLHTLAVSSIICCLLHLPTCSFLRNNLSFTSRNLQNHPLILIVAGQLALSLRLFLLIIALLYKA